MREFKVLIVLAGIWTLASATPACAIASPDNAAGYATQDGDIICINNIPQTIIPSPSISPITQTSPTTTAVISFPKLELRSNSTSNSTETIVYYTPLPGVSAKPLTTKHSSSATKVIAAEATVSSISVSTAGSVATAVPWGSKGAGVGAGVALGFVGLVMGAL